MATPKMMRAARLYDVASPLVIDEIAVPSIKDDEVLIRVNSCGIVPNLQNVIRHFQSDLPFLPLPKFPAIFGLDPAGEIAQVGANVKDLAVGDRVYVNPMRSCNACRYCYAGERILCKYATLGGYFGLSPRSVEMHDRYPWGGFGEYMAAPAYAAIRIPRNVSFEEAARFGYIGTAFAGLRRANLSAGSTLLIGGASGTLGVGAIISALALGAKRILCVARNRPLLEQIKSIAPRRIETWSTLDGPIAGWVGEWTDGQGAEVAIDCLPTGAPADMFLECLDQLAPGGAMVNVGGVVADVPIAIYKLMHKGARLIGSNWFEHAHAIDMAGLAETGVLDLSIFEHSIYPLDQIDRALGEIDPARGGLANYVIRL